MDFDSAIAGEFIDGALVHHGGNYIEGGD